MHVLLTEVLSENNNVKIASYCLHDFTYYSVKIFCTKFCLYTWRYFYMQYTDIDVRQIHAKLKYLESVT